MKALEFSGRGGEYFRIWIVNLLLTIVTLSVYHPWAKVRTRRYFLGNTRLEGRGFDYHATGRQLLPGHLVVMALVLVFAAIQAVIPLIGLLLVAVLFLAGPWIIWRSLSFNARMTSFSTVRFGFEGTAGGAYRSYLLWPVLFVLSLAAGPVFLGLAGQALPLDTGVGAVTALLVPLSGYALACYAYAAMRKRQTRYVVDGHRYGQGRFASAVRARGFAKILAKSLGLALLLLVVLTLLVTGVAFATGLASELWELGPSLGGPDTAELLAENGAALVLLGMIYGSFLFLGLSVFAYAHTRHRAYIFGQTRLDDTVGLASTLGARRYAWTLLSNLLLLIVTLGLATPWARTRLARVLTEHTEVDTTDGFDAYVNQKRAEQSSLGEQIGEAFDVDVGVGF